MRTLAITFVTVATLLVGGCTPASIGRPLGGIVDLELEYPGVRVPSVIWIENLPELESLIAPLDVPDLQQKLAEVDPAGDLVVTFGYDACSTQDPELFLSGSELSVRFRTDLHRNCVRAVAAVAVWAVPRVDLPEKVSYLGQEYVLG